MITGSLGLIQCMDWFGCIFGVAGSLLLSLNNRYSGWGFVLFLGSNICWTYFGIATHANGLLTSQLFFTATSSFGIYRWLIKKQNINT